MCSLGSLEGTITLELILLLIVTIGSSGRQFSMLEEGPLVFGVTFKNYEQELQGQPVSLCQKIRLHDSNHVIMKSCIRDPKEDKSLASLLSSSRPDVKSILTRED